MIFKSKLFWDTDHSKLNMEQHKAYIIPRVMDKGSLDDVRRIMSHYSKDVLLQVLKDAPYLDKKTISFCELYFGVPRAEFRAYQRSLTFKTWK